MSGGSSARRVDLTGLTANTAYTVSIRGRNAAGNGAAGSTTFTTLVSKPVAPTVSHSSVTHNSATISFTPGTGGGAATSWEARRGATGVWSTIPGGAAARSFNVSLLLASTSYTFYVRGRNAGGAGAAGTTTFSTLAPPPTKPHAPTLTAVAKTHTVVTLTWTAATTGTAAASWQYRIGAAGVWTDVPSSTGSTTTYDVGSLTASTDYDFYLRGRNAQGDGAASAVASARTLDEPLNPPPAPVNLTAVPGIDSVKITWEPGTVTSAHDPASSWEYRVGAGPWTAIPGGAAARSHTITSLVSAADYAIDVRGVNADEDGASAQVTFTTPALQWERNLDGGDWQIIPGGATPRMLTLDGLESARTYVFGLRVRNHGGASAAVYRTFSTERLVWEYRLNEGPWVEIGFWPVRMHALPLQAFTGYTLDLRGRNSAGAGDYARLAFNTLLSQPIPILIPLLEETLGFRNARSVLSYAAGRDDVRVDPTGEPEIDLYLERLFAGRTDIRPPAAMPLTLRRHLLRIQDRASE